MSVSIYDTILQLSFGKDSLLDHKWKILKQCATTKANFLVASIVTTAPEFISLVAGKVNIVPKELL
jgi:hypothetical protein